MLSLFSDVWWITPTYGSYAGGTLLTLHGRGKKSSLIQNNYYVYTISNNIQ